MNTPILPIHRPICLMFISVSSLVLNRSTARVKRLGHPSMLIALSSEFKVYDANSAPHQPAQALRGLPCSVGLHKPGHD
jgi:hypothetical protein